MRRQENRHSCLRARALTLLFATIAGAPIIAQTRPATYAEFSTSVAPSDGAALKAAITGKAVNYIYLQRGYYVLANPVVIDRTTPLFIHGADRMSTVLVASDPTQPLFVVHSAPLVNFAGVRLQPSRNRLSTLYARAISSTNTQPVN